MGNGFVIFIQFQQQCFCSVPIKRWKRARSNFPRLFLGCLPQRAHSTLGSFVPSFAQNYISGPATRGNSDLSDFYNGGWRDVSATTTFNLTWCACFSRSRYGAHSNLRCLLNLQVTARCSHPFILLQQNLTDGYYSRRGLTYKEKDGKPSGCLLHEQSECYWGAPTGFPDDGKREPSEARRSFNHGEWIVKNYPWSYSWWIWTHENPPPPLLMMCIIFKKFPSKSRQ